MKNRILFSIGLLSSLLLSGCGSTSDTNEVLIDLKKDKFSVGVIFPDVGMGDQSFNDLVVDGLLDARENLDIIWSYSDLTVSDTLEDGLETLLAEDHDVIIGVGYTSQPLLEEQAHLHPDQRFAIIDSVSDVQNIDSIVFNEKEGSYLAGVLAANITKTNVLGFLGGMEDEVIWRFYDGFVAGAQSVNPTIQVRQQFTNTYSDAALGAKLASTMIAEQADVLYAAAGYSGVGLLQQAQEEGVYAIGVDSDQYFYAEQAVITSMQKNLDVAVYSYIEELIHNPNSEQQTLQFGVSNDGVGLSPIRVVKNATELEEALQQTDVPTSMN